MKQLSLAAIAALCIFCSCNQSSDNKDSKTETAMTDNSGNDKREEMLKANREVLHAIETGDTAVLQKYIADDAVDHGGGPNGTDVKGKDIIKMLAGFHKDVDNLKMEVVEDAANDDHVFALVRMTGTTNKPIWGMPAKAPVDWKSVDVVKIKDMKMTDHWAFVDAAAMMQAAQGGGGNAAGDKPANGGSH